MIQSVLRVIFLCEGRYAFCNRLIISYLRDEVHHYQSQSQSHSCFLKVLLHSLILYYYIYNYLIINKL